MKNGKVCFGVIIGTRAYFNSELAKDVKKQLLKTLDEKGYEYVILPEDATPTGSSSIETLEDGIKNAELFRAHRDEIDGILVSLPNFGYEIGIINTIFRAELNVPVLVQACDDDNDKVDLDSRRDAFCGKISVCNNLYQYGIPFSLTSLHTYSIYSEEFKKDVDKFAGICRVVGGLRHCRIGQIGTRPLGFNTCRASEKLLQRSGITVVPADLSEILFAAQKITDDDPALLAKLKDIHAYAKVPAEYQEKLRVQAKFGVAVEAWVRDNKVDALALQCWDSLEQNYGCAPCITWPCLAIWVFLAPAKPTSRVLSRCWLSVWLRATLLPWPTGTTTLPTTATSAYAPTAATSRVRSSATMTSSSPHSAYLDAHSARYVPSAQWMPRSAKASSPSSAYRPTMLPARFALT